HGRHHRPPRSAQRRLADRARRGLRDRSPRQDDAQGACGLLAETTEAPPYLAGAGAAFFTAAFLSSFSSALRTCLNSSSEAGSTFGNFRFSASSAVTITEPITTRANHLWSAGTTYQGAAGVEVWRITS